MRYSSTRKQETRDKLLRSSAAVAKKSGFGTSGVDALMASIGLTGGAFYSHFESKDELFAALVEREMEHTARMLAAPGAAPAGEVADRLGDYLSTRHALHPETGCALTTLASEIARGPAEVRAVVDRSLRKLQREWRQRLGGDGDQAWALLAQCVGAVLLARAVGSERTRREILAANRRRVDLAPGGD